MIYALYSMFFASLFIGCKKKSYVENKSIFSKKETTILKGLFAIFVLLHHLGQICSVNNVLGLNSHFGGIAVGIFFMLSAYGLYKSYNSNGDNFVKKIFFNKIPKLYLTQLLINLIYYFVFYYKQLSVKETILRILNLDIFFGYERLNSYSWFITTILFVYIIFGLSIILLKLFKTKNKKLTLTIIMTIGISLLSLLITILPINSLYNRSILCFLIGIWVVLFEDKIILFISKNKNWIISFLISILLLLICVWIGNERLISFFFSIFMVLLCAKLSFDNNQYLYFLGNISLEIYLFQYMFFRLTPIQSLPLEFLLVFGATIIVLFLFHCLIKYINKCFDFLINIHQLSWWFFI